jgi:hypothetical protein
MSPPSASALAEEIADEAYKAVHLGAAGDSGTRAGVLAARNTSLLLRLCFASAPKMLYSGSEALLNFRVEGHPLRPGVRISMVFLLNRDDVSVSIRFRAMSK